MIHEKKLVRRNKEIFLEEFKNKNVSEIREFFDNIPVELHHYKVDFGEIDSFDLYILELETDEEFNQRVERLNKTKETFKNKALRSIKEMEVQIDNLKKEFNL